MICTAATHLVVHNETGILGDGVGIGNAAIVAYMRRGTIRRNIIAGGDALRYGTAFSFDRGAGRAVPGQAPRT
jgi:hypothetical protein